MKSTCVTKKVSWVTQSMIQESSISHPYCVRGTTADSPRGSETLIDALGASTSHTADGGCACVVVPGGAPPQVPQANRDGRYPKVMLWRVAGRAEVLVHRVQVGSDSEKQRSFRGGGAVRWACVQDQTVRQISTFS